MDKVTLCALIEEHKAEMASIAAFLLKHEYRSIPFSEQEKHLAEYRRLSDELSEMEHQLNYGRLHDDATL